MSETKNRKVLEALPCSNFQNACEIQANKN